MKTREQRLAFEIAHQSELSDRAIRIMMLIHKMPRYYHLKENLAGWAHIMKCSVRSVQRALRELLKYGLIKVKYGKFKRLFLRLAPISVQTDHCNGNKLAGLIHNEVRFSKWKPKVTPQITTPMSQRTKESIKENYSDNIERIKMLRENALLKLGVAVKLV